jgi:uncharacterized SAM-binding protein YcdF (DUF218 family)
MSRTFAIVLGAAVWTGGVASPTLRRRAETAAALYLAGKVDGIVATGGIGVYPPSEAEVLRDLLTARGVPDGAVILETRSRSTMENIAFAAALLPEGSRLVLVSDAWHLPRARLIARRLKLRAEGAAPPLRGARPLFTARAILREIAAIVALALRLGG